jgi:hypothetical protein
MESIVILPAIIIRNNFTKLTSLTKGANNLYLKCLLNSSGYGKEKDDNRIDRKQPPNLSTVYDTTRMINKSSKKFHQIITPIKYRVSPGIERKVEPTEHHNIDQQK